MGKGSGSSIGGNCRRLCGRVVGTVSITVVVAAAAQRQQLQRQRLWLR